MVTITPISALPRRSRTGPWTRRSASVKSPWGQEAVKRCMTSVPRCRILKYATTRLTAFSSSRSAPAVTTGASSRSPAKRSPIPELELVTEDLHDIPHKTAAADGDFRTGVSSAGGDRIAPAAASSATSATNGGDWWSLYLCDGRRRLRRQRIDGSRRPGTDVQLEFRRQHQGQRRTAES